MSPVDAGGIASTFTSTFASFASAGDGTLVLVAPRRDEELDVDAARGGGAQAVVEGAELGAVAVLRLVREHLDADRALRRAVDPREETRELRPRRAPPAFDSGLTPSVSGPSTNAPSSSFVRAQSASKTRLSGVTIAGSSVRAPISKMWSSERQSKFSLPT